MKKILIAASGTGGHLFPAIAVAEALTESWNISWLGVPDRLETKLVPKKYGLVTIPAGGLQGSPWQKILQLIKLLVATRSVRKLILRRKIDIVFTTGGYIAAPAILGAFTCGIPIIIHESNAIPGRVTRLMGRFCNVVALGFPTKATKSIRTLKIVITGTPIRSEFFRPQAQPSWVPKGKGPLIVVMGGSQGAVGLNLMVEAVLPSLLEAGCKVVHITGEQKSKSKKNEHPNLIETAFTNEIPGLLQHADLVISRAGAGSLSEIAMCGTPAVLVPYPFATDQHQEANAAYIAAKGAAVIVHEHLPTHRALNDALWRLLKTKVSANKNENDPLIGMRKAMQELGAINAKEKLIDLIEQVK